MSINGTSLVGLPLSTVHTGSIVRLRYPNVIFSNKGRETRALRSDEYS